MLYAKEVDFLQNNPDIYGAKNCIFPLIAHYLT